MNTMRATLCVVTFANGLHQALGAMRSARALGSSNASLDTSSEISASVTAAAVVLVVALVIGGAVMFSVCDCYRRKKPQPMAAQINKPLDLDAPRPRFEYVEFNAEKKLMKKLPKGSLSNLDPVPPGFDPADNAIGYIDVTTEDEPMTLEEIDIPISPTSNRRFSTSVLDAFSSIPSSPAPAYIEVSSVKPGGDEAELLEFGFGELEGELSRENSELDITATDMNDDDDGGTNELFTGFQEAHDQADENGFGFGAFSSTDDPTPPPASVSPPPATEDVTSEDVDDDTVSHTDISIDDEAPKPTETFGFGNEYVDEGPPPAVLPEGTEEKIDSALDVLNDKESEIEERVEAIDTIRDVMALEGGTREVYEMNGTVSLAAVIKEELDVEIQEKCLLALNMLCEIPDGLAEVVQSGMPSVWIDALEHQELFDPALKGLHITTQKANEMGIGLMLSAGAIKKLGFLVDKIRSDEQLVHIIEVLDVLAKHASRIRNIDGLFTALNKLLRNPAHIAKVVGISTSVLTTFGDEGSKFAQESGITDRLRAISEDTPDIPGLADLLEQLKME